MAFVNSAASNLILFHAMGAAVAKMVDVKTDGLQKKPIVEDDEPDEWFVALSPARFSLRVRFATNHRHHSGTRGYLVRDVQVSQVHFKSFGDEC